MKKTICKACILFLPVFLFTATTCKSSPKNWPVFPMPCGFAVWFGEPLDYSLEIDALLLFPGFTDKVGSSGPVTKIEPGKDGAVTGIGWRESWNDWPGGLSVFISYLTPWSDNPKYMDPDKSYYGCEFEATGLLGVKISNFKEISGENYIHSVTFGLGF